MNKITTFDSCEQLVQNNTNLKAK